MRQIGNTLPMPYKFRPAADLATEIEWAKNRRLPPERYRAELGDHEPPIPADLMHRVYSRYENGKQERGVVDFEDLLELTVRLFEEDEQALAVMRDRYRAFTVDEYQDVNLLQQTLLEQWVGARDDLCVVGDDYQSIYAFTGASAQYLLAMPKAVSARRCDPAGGELPLDGTDPRAGEQARAEARRRRRRRCVRRNPTGPGPSLRAARTRPHSSSGGSAHSTFRMTGSPSSAGRTRA